MRRVNVVGSTGSGKTAFARVLAQRLGIPHIELDAYHWGPQWTEVPNDVFRLHVAESAKGNTWIIDGNYSLTRDLVWPRADTIIWLDYSFGVIFLRLTRRIIRRGFLRERLWNDKVENPLKHFFTKDSLYLWLVRSHWRRRRQLVDLMSQPANENIKFVRLKSPLAAHVWLAKHSIIQLTSQVGTIP